MRFADFSVTAVYGVSYPVYLFFVVLSVLFFFPLARPSSAADDNYLDVLLKSAREKRLYEDRYWDILVHYKHHGSGMKSLIDDPKFFLAPDGKRNPAAELEATIRSFFREERNGEEHPRCRFVARYAWLKEKLDIDELRLPPVDCTEFDEALKKVNPHSAALVFPTTLNNSPGSMFGHTLIRIDSEKQSDLLSYAVTYAAAATDTNGFLYAFKGIFGYYPGYFSILPYYEKVAEYSNIEYRDIWEYHLNLTEEEVRRLVMHVWELRDIYADYYFFDENCSFDLLFLLEVARPSLHLTDAFWDNKVRFWVIPIDTIRVIKESGLITGEKYRPSQATRILAIASHMESGNEDVALDVVDKKTSPQAVVEMQLAREEKMMILDLSAELLQYKYSRKQLEKEEYLKQYLPVLSARSSLGKQDADAYSITPPIPPEQGHLPGRLSFGGGYRTDSFFTEIGWRAAYHDLLDPDEGFTEGAQINFFDISGRYYFKEDRAQLQRLRLIDIVSLSPRDAFFKPVSWKVNTGFDRELFSDGDEHLIYRLNPGGGFSYKSGFLGLSYIMIETDLELSGGLQDNYSLGFGASAGIIKRLSDSWKIDLSAKSVYYVAGDEHRSIKTSLVQNFKITTNNSIAFSLSWEKTFDRYQSEGNLSWNIYF
ncbi:MAG TPA: DUF4105 domain-containing protein [Nitrospirota bacterium]|nr:DUF4105 domain-containing protein [Nitrospirota bacterium]